MLHSKIRAKRLDSIVEDGEIFIVLEEPNEQKIEAQERQEPKNQPLAKAKVSVATVLALFQKENNYLKNRIVQLESKIDKLIDDKEQMLRDERDKLEQIYTNKDEQLKNILTLVNKKMHLEEQRTFAHEAPNMANAEQHKEAQLVSRPTFVELKEYLRSLNLRSIERKTIKRRFLNAYDNDARVIHKDGKLYLDLAKYDYSDLLHI